jgi:hypothetical protein
MKKFNVNIKRPQASKPVPAKIRLAMVVHGD